MNLNMISSLTSPSPLSLLPLFFVLLCIITSFSLLLSSPSFLSPNTTRSPTAKRTRQRKVDMLLAVQSNDKAGHVYDLLSHSDMALPDEDTGVMN